MRLKIGVASLVFLALLLGWSRFLQPAADGPGLAPLALVPAVAILAFLFETTDSGFGMGFGTALSPLLLAMGYEPLAVVPALLLAESATGLLSGLFHHEFKNVEFSVRRPVNEATRATILVSGIGMAAVAISVVLTYLAFETPAAIVKTYVGVLVILMGAIGLVRYRLRPVTRYRPRRLVAFAILAGLNKGVGGGGYGPVVTLGEIFAGVYEKSAAAIVSMAEGMVSLMGLVTFFAIAAVGVALDFTLVPSILTGSFLAAILAPYAVRVIPNRIYRCLVPTYAMVVGAVLLLDLYVF